MGRADLRSGFRAYGRHRRALVARYVGLRGCAFVIPVPLTKRPDQDDGQKPAGQARPKEERCLLREPAITAGAEVKKACPVVMVTIVDTENGTIEVRKD